MQIQKINNRKKEIQLLKNTRYTFFLSLPRKGDAATLDFQIQIQLIQNTNTKNKQKKKRNTIFEKYAQHLLFVFASERRRSHLGLSNSNTTNTKYKYKK